MPKLEEKVVALENVVRFPHGLSLIGTHPMKLAIPAKGADRGERYLQPVRVVVPEGTTFVHVGITGVTMWFETADGQDLVERPIARVICDIEEQEGIEDGKYWKFVLWAKLQDHKSTEDWTMNVGLELLFFGEV